MDGVFETINHGTSFPARVFVTQIDQCDFHWHYDYEILLVLKGTVTVYSSFQPAVMHAGDLCLFNSRTIHGIQRTGEDNLCLCIQFSPSVISEKLESEQFYYFFYLNSTTDMLPREKTYREFAVKMAEIALLNQENKDHSPLRTYGRLLSLLADLIEFVQYDIRRMPAVQDTAFHEELYNDIMKYISEHLQEPNLVDMLCKDLGLSEKSLYRYLKSTLALTPKEFIDIARIEKARHMLRETRKSMSLIWETCGFASEVSFYRNFKKQMGITPNDYRRSAFEPVKHHSTFAHDSYIGFNLGEATELMRAYVETAGSAEDQKKE